MSECDKAKIVGYVEQTPDQIERINSLKSAEVEIVKLLECIARNIKDTNNPELLPADPRWLSIAKTHIQQGFMAAVRAVARPNGD